MGFTVLYAPGLTERPSRALRAGRRAGSQQPEDYAELILTSDRQRFFNEHPADIRATTDDRPFFFHTTKLENQYDVAFGRAMLFGNGLSALLTLIMISTVLVLLFVLGPLAFSGRELLSGSRWLTWLGFFGCLGAGFMLIEVPLLQQFTLLLGHPTYSLSVTLFSLLLGTGIGSYVSRRIADARLRTFLVLSLLSVAGIVVVAMFSFPSLINAAMGVARPVRIVLSVMLLLPVGLLLGVPLPAGVRLLAARRAQLVPWAWAMNAALSVMGTTLAVFIAMNWGYWVTLLTGASLYVLAISLVTMSTRPARVVPE
jgi:hypothetical protein